MAVAHCTPYRGTGWTRRCTSWPAALYSLHSRHPSSRGSCPAAVSRSGRCETIGPRGRPQFWRPWKPRPIRWCARVGTWGLRSLGSCRRDRWSKVRRCRLQREPMLADGKSWHFGVTRVIINQHRILNLLKTKFRAKSGKIMMNVN